VILSLFSLFYFLFSIIVAMTSSELARVVKEQGRALGFDRVGIAPVGDFPELAFFREWKQRGLAGEMDYLHDPRREDVRRVLPEARSVICCALVYNTPQPYSTEVPHDAERGWLSRYAWGNDYHEIVEEKLDALRAEIAKKAGAGFAAKLYVDTGPVVERVYAKYAGLGWLAKNTCVLDAELGSWFFLGVLVTNLELEPDSPLPDGCGSCQLCLEACPTGALDPARPYQMDARRCISYLTIELRGPIPDELRPLVGRHVFGCDICQDVCPYNRRAWLTDAVAFLPRQLELRASSIEHREVDERSPMPEARSDSSASSASFASSASLFHPRLAWLASLSEADFREVFKRSAVRRAKWRGLLRNVLLAMGNSAHT
jgi:epoxyqueuosine reductase